MTTRTPTAQRLAVDDDKLGLPRPYMQQIAVVHWLIDTQRRHARETNP